MRPPMQKLKIGLLILVFSWNNVAVANTISKAYDALKIYNYFEAKRLFEKSLKSKTAAAAYGLSIIYSRSDNPFSNIDSAYKFINTSKNAFQYISEDTKDEYADYNVTK